MATPHAVIALTPEERLARRQLIVRDAVSLVTLFLITAVIFLLTLLLFRSFTSHRAELGARWKMRGEAAMHAGNPAQAIDALRSALAYVPSRDTEIELATALADAGRTQEATVYFSTLWESAPGDGTINLQLARLAAKEGNESQAILHYQAALDGTWQGNGYDRRREVRLEMAGYLIARHEFDPARTQLLIAEGNAPDDPAIKLAIASLMEQAADPQDALRVYRTVALHHDAPIAAFEGAGRTAFALGMFHLADDYLTRALASPPALSEDQKSADHNMLETSRRILLLYPSFDLAPRPRAQRVLAIKDTARQRLTDCAASTPSAPPKLADLVARWGQIPPQLNPTQLEQQPDMERNILNLAFDTEILTAQICGSPTGTNALLLRIARNPSAVEQD